MFKIAESTYAVYLRLTQLYCIDNYGRFSFSGVGKGEERKPPVNCQYN